MSRQPQRYFWSRLLGLAVSSLALGAIISGVGMPLLEDATLQSAHATTSGGRSRGGSFGDDTPPPSSNDSNSSDNDNTNGNSGTSRNSSPSPRRSSNRNDRNRTYDSSEPSRPMNFVEGLVLMSVIGASGAIAYKKLDLQSAQAGTTAKNQPSSAASTTQAASRPVVSSSVVSRQLSGEITNNIVTITQLQVAMVSEARHVQQALNQIAEEGDLSTSDGLTLALRETVVTLLRSPETWTHAIATSKTVNTKQEAKQHFEALSIEERSKFDVESMVNVDGKVKHREAIERAEEVASHIVVTLIVGTAHDSAVIDTPVMSSEELRTALKQLGSITPDYLMVYEVLWSPQDESDSLTADELLLNYPKMFQL